MILSTRNNLFERFSIRNEVVLFVVLLAVSFLATGYSVYNWNHALQIPHVNRISDSSLYPGDPFVESLDSYLGVLWPLLAFLGPLVSLKVLLAVGFIMERLLGLFAARELARAFCGENPLPRALAMTLYALAPIPLLGAGTLVPNYFEHTGLSVPFFMLAAAALARRRYFAWAIFAGIGVNLNVMYGLYAFTYFAVIASADPDIPKKWKSLLPAVVLFILLCSWQAWGALKILLNSGDGDGSWVRVAESHLPFHLFPMTWKWERFARVGALMAIAFIVFKYSKTRSKGGLAATLGFRFNLVALGWLVFAFVAAYVINARWALSFQAARGMDLWYFLAGIPVICLLAGDSPGPAKIFSLLAACVVLVPEKALIACAAAGVTLFLLKSRAFPAWCNKRAAILAVLGFALVVGLTAFARRACEENGVSRAAVKAASPGVSDLAEWANHNTPVNAAFLVPPHQKSFRALLRRPVFVTWKDGAAMLWDRGYMNIWVERLGALGIDVLSPDFLDRTKKVSHILEKAYNDLEKGDVLRIKDKYGLDYMVVQVGENTAFKTVYQNEFYKIVKTKRP